MGHINFSSQAAPSKFLPGCTHLAQALRAQWPAPAHHAVVEWAPGQSLHSAGVSGKGVHAAVFGASSARLSTTLKLFLGFRGAAANRQDNLEESPALC